MQKLTSHLHNFVVDQQYDNYTAQDHAVWRYVMRQNLRYLPKVAHASYLDGIKKTGISIDYIPRLTEMNKILGKIGWAAVTVDGFIPPAAFMEFQAYRVLPIAADIRPIENIEYTPAPDILHEVAGHAPIIANEEYAQFLQFFGELGSKAFSSKKDHEIYEAVRHLSILKTDPKTPESEIIKVSNKLEQLEASNSTFSEMTQIRNLHWWTVEYGLIGSLENPKIYGAGLLSSIGESFSSLQPDVKKLPLNLDTKNVKFDITSRQPQLFVAEDFSHLNAVLNDFSKEMAFIKGGVLGVQNAIDSARDASCVYSSGLQVSGVFNEMIHSGEEIIYLRTNSPTALCFEDKELIGHGKEYHHHGFGSPVGKLKGYNKRLENFGASDFLKAGIEQDKAAELQFEHGVKVKGILRSMLHKEGKNLLLTFSDCLVTYEDQVLFEPSWGMYDMAIGEKIISTFSAPADPEAYGYQFPAPEEKTIKIHYSEKQRNLHQLYQLVRELRENGAAKQDIDKVYHSMVSSYPDEWLLMLDLLEVALKNNADTSLIIQQHLDSIARDQMPLAKLIRDGLELL